MQPDTQGLTDTPLDTLLHRVHQRTDDVDKRQNPPAPRTFEPTS